MELCQTFAHISHGSAIGIRKDEPKVRAQFPMKARFKRIAAPLADAKDLGKPFILVARPELCDPLLRVHDMVVTPFGAHGHLGFIVNRPTGLTLAKIFLEHLLSRKIADPVYLGGPVQPWLVFALVQHRGGPGGNSFKVMPGLYAAYEAAVLNGILESEPKRARFIAGHVAWCSGELRAEIDLGAW
ncbi:MAG TPA: YqgE/AlgH family protein [Burkholderiales bacterium]|nr:YqgE/AlgH family protein [Burkholderiales bacterium]